MTPPAMHSETKESSASAPRQPGLWGWLNRRTGVDGLLRTALYEPIPGGARFAYVFGSGLLFIFISQIITGVFLALYYVPSADHAHTTVAYITKSVTAGSFLRSLHAYGASAMIVVLLLHLSQTYIYGAYKGRRELLWLSGCLLFALILGMAGLAARVTRRVSARGIVFSAAVFIFGISVKGRHMLFAIEAVGVEQRHVDFVDPIEE